MPAMPYRRWDESPDRIRCYLWPECSDVRRDHHRERRCRTNASPTTTRFACTTHLSLRLISSTAVQRWAVQVSRTPGVAPALANALFDATGKRVRTLPVIKADLRSDAEASPSLRLRRLMTNSELEKKAPNRGLFVSMLTPRNQIKRW